MVAERRKAKSLRVNRLFKLPHEQQLGQLIAEAMLDITIAFTMNA